MLKFLVLITTVLALAIGVAAQPAAAQEPIDVSGEWTVAGLGSGPGSDDCPLVVSQAGTLLAAAAECSGGMHLHGHIDPSSGEFTLGGRSKNSLRFDFVGTASNELLIISSSPDSFDTFSGLEAVRNAEAPERHNLSGNWATRLSGEPEGSFCVTSISQRDEAMTIDLDCGARGSGRLTGGIDVETGEFSAGGELFGSLGHMEGFGSRSGRALSAIWSVPGVGQGTLTSHLEQVTGGALAVDCDGDTDGIQSSCAYDVGTTFRVQLHVTELPAEGFNGFELHLRWTPPQLTYIRSERLEDELVEPNCEVADRGNQWVREPRYPVVSYVCLNEPLPQTEPLLAGVPVELQMACFAGGRGALSLAVGNGPVLINGGLRSFLHQILPAMSDASVWCRPDARSQPGDVNCNGLVNSIDALLVLQYESGELLTLSCLDNADLNDDSVVNSVDASLILQFNLGLTAP